MPRPAPAIALAGALSSALTLAAAPASACDTALLLSIDVSSSIDLGEYRLQTDGLADALADPDIAAALVEGQVALAVMQWSGVGSQSMVLDWTRMTGPAEVERFAGAARRMERAYVNSDTAIGDAIAFAAKQFGPVADCQRHVIDVSGDGTENAGGSTVVARQAAEAAGLVVNGIAIESIGVAITNFYRRSVISHDGFVVTARGHLDYPRAIRKKIAREVTKVTG
jgi:Ca-activated chloride channel family protein